MEELLVKLNERELRITRNALYEMIDVMKEILKEETNKKIIDIRKIKNLNEIISDALSAFQKLGRGQ